MFSQLKRSFTDLRLHGLSTRHPHKEDFTNGRGSDGKSKTSSRRQEMRLSGAASDSSRETQPLLDHQAPISEGLPGGEEVLDEGPLSNSHYTTPGSISPLHSNAIQKALQAQTSSVIAQPTTTHSEPKCSYCGSFKARGDSDIQFRIDRLSRQLETLENSVGNDIRIILSLLRRQGNGKVADSVDQRESSVEAKSRPSPVRRSSSVPQHDLSFTPSSSRAHEPSRLPYPSPLKGQHVLVPRRSQSQPVDLSFPSAPQQRLNEDILLSPSISEKSDDAWKGLSDLGRKRQILASSRGVSSTDEAEALVAQAPIARLDSLQEMETALISSRTSLSDAQTDARSSQV